MAFSDSQVEQALRESMAQGFSLEDSLRGAAEKFGVQQDQLDRAKNTLGSTKPDVVGNLQNAGLKESPANLIQQLSKTQPDFTKGFDFSNIGRMGDESTGVIQGPSTEFGGYNVKALGEFADVGEGSYAPTGALGGYEATKTETQQNGKPLISTLKYDASGALTGRTVRAYEGSDSGTEYRLDAAGNVIGSSKFDDSEAWKTTAAALLPMATMAFAPGLSNYFAGLAGAGTAGATAAEVALAKAAGAGATGALFSGTGAALAGKEGSDLLKAAALGGASSAVGAGLAGEAGKYAGKLVEDPYASQIVRSAVEGGIKALPGAIATGDYGRTLTGALVGGGMAAADMATANVDVPFTRQQAEAGLNLARAISSGNMVSAANAAATLINNPDITVATRAATLLKAFNSGNINAIMAATQMLSNSLGKPEKTTATRTAEAPGGAFETSAIIEPGDAGGTIVPGEAGEDYVDPNSVVVTGQTEPADLFSLLDIDALSSQLPTSGVSTATPKGDQQVSVTGSKIPMSDEVLDSLLNDVFVATGPTQRVPITGKNLKGGDTGTSLVEDITNQRVELPGSRIKPVNGGEGVSTTPPTIPTETNDEGQIEVIGKRIKPVVDAGEGVVEDITNQRVELPGKRIKPVNAGEGVVKTTTPTTTTTITTPTTPVTPKTTTPSVPTPAYRPFTPIPEAQAQQPFRPGLADVFYGKGAVRFGPDAPSMADVTDFQGRKAQARRSMELALEGAGGENQADDAYERLISLAQESPESTVEELMKIIEGGQRG